MAKNKQNKGVLVAEIGAGVLAAAAAAGAGYYFYASSDAKKHRKVAAKWAGGLKKEVMKEAKSLKQFDARSLGRVVDETALAYATARKIDRGEVMAAAKELKHHWERIQSEIKKGGKKAVKAVKKAKARPVAKKKKKSK